MCESRYRTSRERKDITNMQEKLLDEILESGNMNKAYKQVMKNKGSHGVDNMSVLELGDYLKTNKENIIR